MVDAYRAASEERQDVKIEGASLELGSLRIPVNITGEGYVDILYVTSSLRPLNSFRSLYLVWNLLHGCIGEARLR